MIIPKEIPHPLYSMFGKRHFDKKITPTYEWRPCMKALLPVDHTHDWYFIIMNLN
mgnify:CR=1 FL=1